MTSVYKNENILNSNLLNTMNVSRNYKEHNFTQNYFFEKNPFNKLKNTRIFDRNVENKKNSKFGPKLNLNSKSFGKYYKEFDKNLESREDSIIEILESDIPNGESDDSKEFLRERIPSLSVEEAKNSKIENNQKLPSIENLEEIEDKFLLKVKEKFERLNLENKKYGKVYKEIMERDEISWVDLRKMCLGDKNKETFTDFVIFRNAENIIFKEEDNLQ